MPAAPLPAPPTMGRVRTILPALLALILQSVPQQGPHQANGIKIGEVDAESAVVWARATRDPAPVAEGPELAREPGAAGGDPLAAGVSLDEVRHAVPGAPGELRVVYWPAGEPEAALETPWSPVSAERDFTHQFALRGLAAGREYGLRCEARPGPGELVSSSVAGRFRTAPPADEARRVVFTVVTGQGFHRRDEPEAGHRIYRSMAALEPDFFVHTGDVVYYDKPGPFAKTVALARFKWNRMYGLPLQRDFHARTASYFMRDDHDTLKNDCWPGQRYGELSWEDGLRIFREEVPSGESGYRRVRWGRDLEVWLLEGRAYRSPNGQPDGPGKTILGAEQLAWLRAGLERSDATFRLVVSSTPIVGPDRSNKNDNHANRGFRTEGEALRRLLADLDDAFVICGDRHWQYVSVDPASGLCEYSCGPTSDAHAGGFPDEPTPMHEYLRVAGGFLSGTVERRSGSPVLVLRHHDVDGGVRHEDLLRAGLSFRAASSFGAQEARQGVAVDAEHVYAIGTRSIGKYAREGGERVASWRPGEDPSIVHLNAGLVVGDRLYGAHSTYPEVPGRGTVEIWDAATLDHLGRHVFDDPPGSLTWVDRHDGHWWACFVHYGAAAGDSVVQKLDDAWRVVASWRFPDAVLQRFAPHSCSGASFGPDGLLYASGHDRPELYALRVPPGGGTLELVRTVPVESEGQGVAFDRAGGGLATIVRSRREVVLSNLVRN